MKYPCGCTATGGPEPLPRYCPEHGAFKAIPTLDAPTVIAHVGAGGAWAWIGLASHKSEITVEDALKLRDWLNTALPNASNHCRDCARLRGVLRDLKARLIEVNAGLPEMGNIDTELVATIDCALGASVVEHGEKP